ncbi:type VI secretion system baseplate subunit TssE [Thalassotalea euphylliae]|uniref:Type VI secretion system baseplate subunit TssE n=1 Tax=Thalassotalea euphylliae TaxID=1655234 RepID=A0A3E0TRN5_9GAMM|nr:type VI secretion system baseplate subunit TssE [Thalassotalea euphylliae]REL26642.1 type VI secretion system baseplate subunit TssE [Thalassotalea euphylliae]
MALFDKLAAPVKYTAVNAEYVEEVESVCKHISLLLNARRGVLSHMPDYGLPDVEDIYEGLPYSQQTLALEVKKLIEKYEPRVRMVNVIANDIHEHDCVIKLDIQAFLVSGSAIKLSTKFASGGQANVQKRANAQ